jgi:hypothetical protein
VAQWRGPPTLAEARSAVKWTEPVDDAILHSIALDMLTAAELTNNDIAEAVQAARTRLKVLDRLTVGPAAGFELADSLLMATEVHLASGDLATAAAYADRLARLPFYRDEDYLAISRHLLVDALAGRHDEVIRTAERFRDSWERAGRPIASNLSRARPTRWPWCTACAATTNAANTGYA